MKTKKYVKERELGLLRPSLELPDKINSESFPCQNHYGLWNYYYDIHLFLNFSSATSELLAEMKHSRVNPMRAETLSLTLPLVRLVIMSDMSLQFFFYLQIFIQDIQAIQN